MTTTAERLGIMLTVWGAACCMTLGALAGSAPWSVTAPSGNLRLTVALRKAEADSGPAVSQRLCYTVQHAGKTAWESVVPWSTLGIVRDDEAFVDNLVFRSAGEVQTVQQSYSMPFGKRHICHVHANTRRLSFQNRHGIQLDLLVWAADEGVAFRYRFPQSEPKMHTVLQERTSCRLPPGSIAWMSPYQLPGMYTPAYEEYYLNGIPIGTPSSSAAGWVFPALFKTPSSRWILLTEAGLDGTYCGSRLAAESPGGVYRFRFPEPGDGAGTGDAHPHWSLPWTMPWRVIMVSDRLGDLFESTLVNDLSAPSRIADTSWIKPGRVAWSWWSDHDSPRDYAKQCRFIDLAAEMGWEYYLVDANWTLMDGGTVRQLIDYAKQKGVGVLLWYNSGGEHNVVTEKPRGTMKARSVRRFEFDMLRRWGVKGVKVDFFQSDKQDIIQQYLGILQDAADYHMLVNFHGCTVPRGWSRTWPNLVSMEAIKGEECYSFDKTYPDRAPEFNTIAPFTRNLVGPADLTPVAFSDNVYPHKTTVAHELALSVVFECGLVHFADSVASYQSLPDGPKDFLRKVPVRWDDTRLIDGQPGKFVAVARRHDHAWYVGVIQAGAEPLRVTLPCGFLASGRFTAHVIGDGNDSRSFGSADYHVTTDDTITLSLRPRGGAVVLCVPEK